MSPTIQLVAVVLVAPAVGAVAVLWLCQRFPNVAALRGSAALAFAVAFWLGHALLAWLQSRTDFAPTQYWQWIPYVTLLAAAAAALIAAVQMPLLSRWRVLAVTSVLSAWLIVPTWPDLEPPRAVTVPLLSMYFFLLATILEPLANRLPSAVLAAHLALSACCSAALIAALVSLTFGESAIIGAGALIGCAIAAWLFPDVAVARALALVYAVNIGGWAFSGAIYPRPPLFALLVTPLAPLALWICAVGPLARKRGITAIAIQSAAVLIVLALAAGYGWIATSTGGDSNW